MEGIDAGANVTDATTVEDAGAVMTSGDQTINGNLTLNGSNTEDASIKLSSTNDTAAPTNIHFEREGMLNAGGLLWSQITNQANRQYCLYLHQGNVALNDGFYFNTTTTDNQDPSRLDEGNVTTLMRVQDLGVTIGSTTRKVKLLLI